MHVTRIEVEGGFLDGLDLRLSPGFNVIIGPRGTGKTSIIELLRFALGVPRLAPDGDPFSQARAVLGGGRVTVTVDDQGEVFRFARSSQDPSPFEPAVELAPLILAQNEIEDVGKDPYGRLNLLDGLRAETNGSRRKQEAVRARIRSLTTAVATASAEAATLADELSRLPEVASALAQAEKEQQKFETSLASFAPQRAKLTEVDAALTHVRLRGATLERAATALRSWSQQLEGAVVQAPALEPSLDDDDELAEIRPLLDEAQRETRMALSTASRAVAHVELRLADVRTTEAGLEAEARDLRRQLESAQEGAGVAARQLADLRSRMAELQSLGMLSEQKRAQVAELQMQRDLALADLDSQRQERYRSRLALVSDLNALLKPHIEISLTQSGIHDAYIEALIEALTGSKLRYNTLAPQIAAAIPPAELVRIAEAGDAEQLARILGVDRDRAARIVGYLSDHGLEEILTTEVEDFVEFLLLDGTEYKTTEQMSTGQRCTVVLPILLGGGRRALIVDQPEDHLDNNFVVDTLIHAIRARKADIQMVLSSHNANIPVLGDADWLLSLGSNGKRGYVKHAGDLNDPIIVKAITSVMEGGREAFERRAMFYEDHLGPA